jgi:hypothetical protein
MGDVNADKNTLSFKILKIFRLIGRPSKNIHTVRDPWSEKVWEPLHQIKMVNGGPILVTSKGKESIRSLICES